MDNSYEEKLDFIIRNYNLFRSLHYSHRFALLEYIFFDIDRLNEDNNMYVISHCDLFSKIPFDDRLPIHKNLPNEASYKSIVLMLMEYEEHFDYLLTLKFDNEYRQKLTDRRDIIENIKNECNKLSNMDINRRKK